MEYSRSESGEKLEECGWNCCRDLIERQMKGDGKKGEGSKREIEREKRIGDRVKRKGE